MITVYDNFEKFLSLEQEWKRLQDISPDATPYQSFEYTKAALEFLSPLQPHILGWSRKGTLMALFPCIIDGKGTLRFINDAHTDFCGPVLSPECAGDYHLCEELAEYIGSCREIKRVRFENMRSRLFQSSLQYHLKGSFLFAYRKFSSLAIPAIGDAKSAIDTLANLSTKEKYRLKNIASKTQKDNLEFKKYIAGENPWPEDMIRNLSASMISAGIRKKSYFSERFLDFLKDIYDSGLMTIMATYAEGEPLACNLFLHGKGEMIDWIALYRDPSSNGRNLLQFIMDFSREGGGVLNFARGVYMYKMHNYRPALSDLDRLRYSKSFLGRAADAAGCFVEEIKRSKHSR